jgi:hypothetical protein
MGQSFMLSSPDGEPRFATTPAFGAKTRRMRPGGRTAILHGDRGESGTNVGGKTNPGE